MFKIKKNDIVEVIAGKDNGKKGKVITVFPENNKALVEGINFAKKHARRTSQDQQSGGIIQKENPIHLSNIKLICKRCNKPVRTGIMLLKDGSRARACKVCKEII